MRHPILDDPWAEEAVGRIDYDFDTLRVGEARAQLVAARAQQLDQWAARFLADCPSATVLHLGCGLGSRVYRVNPPEGALWFDVDHNEAIEIRRRLYPERPGYRMIGASLADVAWLDDVPSDRPAFIVGEGVTMYLTEGIIKGLLTRLVDHFPNGQMGFDVHSRELVRWTTRSGATVRDTGASFGWGIDGPQDLIDLEPRLQLVADVRAPDLEGYSKMGWGTRAFVRATDAIPALRRMRCLLFRFSAQRNLSVRLSSSL